MSASTVNAIQADINAVLMESALEKIARGLHDADALRPGPNYRHAWHELTGSQRAFFLERASMSVALCNLDRLTALHHRLACALEQGCDAADRAVLASLGDDPLSLDADDLLNELAARGIAALFQELKGAAPARMVGFPRTRQINVEVIS